MQQFVLVNNFEPQPDPYASRHPTYHPGYGPNYGNFVPPTPARNRAQTDPGGYQYAAQANANYENGRILASFDTTGPNKFLGNGRTRAYSALAGQNVDALPGPWEMEIQPSQAMYGPGPWDRVPAVKVSVLLAAWAFSGISWVVGLLYPSAIVTVFPDTKFTRTDVRSVVELIKILWEKQLIFSLVLIAAFSLLVPACKIIISGRFLCEMCSKNRVGVARGNATLLKFLHYSASYQMLDIYVGVLFISYFNCDSSSATFAPGFYWFFVYCFTSTMISQLVDFELREAVLKDKSIEDVEQGTGSERGVWFFSFAFLISMLVVIVSDQPLLEVRTLFDGITIDRRALSLGDMIFFFVPNYTHPIVTIFICVFCVYLPMLYAILALAPYIAMWCSGQESQRLARIAHTLQPWAMTDVFCLASYVFLFVMQDQNMATRPPTGAYMYYVFLGSGFSFFFLRWFAGLEDHPRKHVSRETIEYEVVGMDSDRVGMQRSMSRDPMVPGSVPGSGVSNSSRSYDGPLHTKHRSSIRRNSSNGRTPTGSKWKSTIRFWFCVVAWCLCCGVLIPGIPGQVPVYSFHSLDSICSKSMPVVDAAIKHLPYSLGDCDNYEVPIPLSCVGHEPLYERDQGFKGFVKAVWIGGLNSMNLNFCHLARSPTDLYQAPAQGKVKYTLSLSGSFGALTMYIKAKQCSGIGCINLDGADYCCGEHLTFSLSFEMECTEGLQPNQLSSVVLKQFELDKIMVKLQKEKHSSEGADGFGQIDAADITTKMREAVRNKLHRFLHGATIVWGGKVLDVPEFLSRLVAYNAPLGEFQC